MAGLEQCISLFRRKDPFWHAARGRFALKVSFGGEETPVVIHGVLGDVRVSPAADILSHSPWGEPAWRRFLPNRVWVGLIHGGGELSHGINRGRGLHSRIRHDQD